MKPTPLRLFALIAALLPALALAAPDGKAKKRPAAAPPGGEAAEILKSFDKNENHQIDADELPAVQKAFATLRKLDKNSNGEIEQAEADSFKAPAADDRKGRALAGLSKADKNGNRKIDADEVEELQKLLGGNQIMTRLDQNGNGKLEPGEVEVLNRRIEQGAGRKPKGSATPSVRKPAAKPAEPTPPAATPKPEEKTDKPAAPAPEAKPPGNFGS